jgi:rhodanese-related sulfurtransferase
MSSFIAVLSLIVLGACGADEPAVAAPPPAAQAAPRAQPGEVDVAALKAAMDAGPVRLIDVRTPAEFADARVPGAVNIPLDELESRLSDVSQDKADEVYLICAVGGRSARATKALAAAGFLHPINVAGGTNGWKAAGMPTDSGPTGDAKLE